MRNSEKIKKLEEELNTLSNKFYKLNFTIENPPKFKKGDTVIWKDNGFKVSSSYLEYNRNWMCFGGYEWMYVIVKGIEITTVGEGGLQPVSKKK